MCVFRNPFEHLLVTHVKTPIFIESSCSELNIPDKFHVIFTIKLQHKYAEERLNVPSASLTTVNTLVQALKLLYATRYRPSALTSSQLYGLVSLMFGNRWSDSHVRVV
jgi:hypothetical protein